MNRFIFILLWVPVGAIAQTETSPGQPVAKPPLLSQEKGQFFKTDSTNPGLNRLNRGRMMLWLAQGRYSHTTDKGKVYLMPIDNMPCLVPDMRKTAQMPTVQPVPDSRMPNVFPSIPAVPKSRK